MPGFPDTKVIDAIMASAAAPVYFPAHDVPGTPGGNAFVDGGVFANNPSTAALAALIGSRLPRAFRCRASICGRSVPDSWPTAIRRPMHASLRRPRVAAAATGRRRAGLPDRLD